MRDVLFYQNYTPVGDISAIVIGVIHWFLLKSTYTIKQKNLTMFKWANVFLVISATSNIVYHNLIREITQEDVFWIYLTRNTYYILLTLMYVLFCIYVSNLVDIKGRIRQIFDWLVWSGFVLLAFMEILGPIRKWGFYIDAELQIHQNYYYDPFWFAYLYFSIIVMCLLIRYRRKFITKMYRCLCNVAFLCFCVIFLQARMLSTAYTCIAFTFPVMAVLFLFHYNAYDAETGTLDSKSFDAYIREFGEKNFTIIFLYLHDMNADRMKSLSTVFFHFNEKYFKDCCTFRLRDNKLAMVYSDDKNKNAMEKMFQLYGDFKLLYQQYKIDYRIVIIQSDDMLCGGRDYFALDEFVEGKMRMNSIHRCRRNDVVDYLKANYILSELRDIYIKQDMDDERVKVFCQPVLHTITDTFTSAEALMRLELAEAGMVFPDQFISIAEKHGYIHTLSKIILNKACKQIKEIERQGYVIDRVSINFSIIELRNSGFCNDIREIIEANGVAYDKIAIELTESKNEKDFENVKRIMTKLHGLGIKFYLDDFGTGYSNFARIISLPIDIIKFDRSLTILAGNDAESEFMVGSFSEIFKKSNYQILFEGVEDERDELQCKAMNALYLQGYKYSKPIPMEQLTDFLEKVE